jgi:hypothetical protein
MSMKKLLLLITILVVPISIGSIYAQNTCKVLLPRIGDSYTGECKQGLADGTGDAFGVDQYKGEFRKGLPDGSGTYIWQTGEKYEGQWKKGLRDGKGTYTIKYMGRDSLQVGMWKNDVFTGAEELPSYVIKYKSNLGRVTIMKMGNTPQYVKFKFTRSGESSIALAVSNLMTTGSSGSESLTNNMVGYENIDFPFEGRVKFTAPNAFNTAMLDCELRYLINEPGAWTVTIFY